MGWGWGIVAGKEVGYLVDAQCEEPGCTENIDRGVSYACGGEHGEGETFCDGYFCADHLFLSDLTDDFGYRCRGCVEKVDHLIGEGQAGGG